MPAGEWPRRNGPLIAWVVGLLVLAVLVYAGTGEPHLRHTSALNAVFDARWLVAGSRLLAAVVLVYLLASIGVRVHRRQWVRSAGSLDTDPSPAQVMADDRERLQQQLVEARATIDDLSGRLEEDLAAVQRAREASDRIAEALGRSERVTREVLPRLRRSGQLR